MGPNEEMGLEVMRMIQVSDDTGEGQSLHQGHRLGREQANPQPWVLGGRTLRAEAAAARGWEGAKTYAGGFCSRILLQKGIQDISIFSF